MSEERSFDVIVVGAGPAGSMAAREAARRGVRVLLIDKEKFPRYKVCGGGVAPWVIKKLSVPSDIIERHAKRMGVCAPPSYEVLEFEMPTGYYLVFRDKFDNYLLKLAREAGAKVLEGVRVTDVIFEGDLVRGVKTTRGEFEAKVVIACDGATSVVARRAGFWDKWFTEKGESWEEHMAFCVQSEIALDDEIIDNRIGNKLMFFAGSRVAPLGYGWIFPKRGIVSVGLGSAVGEFEEKPTEYLRRFIEEHPVASRLLEGGRIVRAKGSYVPFKHTFKPSYDNGILVAGDACGHVSPITGEGIFYAVRAGMIAGEVAAESIRRGDQSAMFLREYEKRWQRVIGVHLDVQAKIFEETYAKLKEVEPEDVDKYYGEVLKEAFLKFIQYLLSYISRKRKG
ncbi:MAG: NAD(P)/FAD-dependent oxidoreductase [Candidatus Baldrarchaeia archaeon]